jgi:hypothetical protein
MDLLHLEWDGRHILELEFVRLLDFLLFDHENEINFQFLKGSCDRGHAANTIIDLRTAPKSGLPKAICGPDDFVVPDDRHLVRSDFHLSRFVDAADGNINNQERISRLRSIGGLVETTQRAA